MKAYIVSDSKNGKENIDGIYYLITEDGCCWYSHWCSNMGYALGDLYDNRPERKAELAAEYGEVEVLYLGEDGMTNSELIAKNHAWHKAQQAEQI